jgi:hypothetical protein
MLIASAQNWSKVLYSSSMVLAISMRVRFFLSGPHSHHACGGHHSYHEAAAFHRHNGKDATYC